MVKLDRGAPLQQLGFVSGPPHWHANMVTSAYAQANRSVPYELPPSPASGQQEEGHGLSNSGSPRLAQTPHWPEAALSDSQGLELAVPSGLPMSVAVPHDSVVLLAQTEGWNALRTKCMSSQGEDVCGPGH